MTVARRYWFLFLYLPVAIFLAYLSYSYPRNGIMRVQAEQSITTKPFVAEYWVTSYAEKPSGEVIEKRLVARRSDGATVTNFVATLTGPGTAPHRELFLPDGRRVFVNDAQGIRSTFYMKDQELARLKNGLALTKIAQGNCSHMQEVFAGKAVVAG